MIESHEIQPVVQAARNLIADRQHHAVGCYARDYNGLSIAWWDDDAESFCISGAIRRALWERAGCPQLREDGWWHDVYETDPIAVDTDKVMSRVAAVVNTHANLVNISEKEGHGAILSVLDRYLLIAERARSKVAAS